MRLQHRRCKPWQGFFLWWANQRRKKREKKGQKEGEKELVGVPPTTN